MKVLLINVVCGIKSTGRICTDIAKELEEAGHTVRIAYGRDIVPEEYAYLAIRIGSKWNAYSHALKTRLFDKCGFGSVDATKRFIEWVKKFDPDVIHLHNLHGYYINIEILFNYLRTCNKRIVWTLHDCWAFTGNCGHFEISGCEKWKSHCESLKNAYCHRKSLFICDSFNNFEKKKALFTKIPKLTIVTPSEWLAGQVSLSYMKEYPIKTIHNGVDLEQFKPIKSNLKTKYEIEDKKIVLGVASSWDETKGLMDFVKLLKLLPKDYQIVLIGLSRKQMKEMPNILIKIEQTNSIRELAEWYSVADVFVNPTYQDTYPTVNLEAQACGTPVLTYKTGGSPESVPQEYVIQKGDLKQLAEKIKLIIQKGQENIKLIKPTGRDKAARDYISIY